MRGKRVKDLRRKLAIIQGHAPIKHKGLKSYPFLEPDPDGTVKGFLLVKGKQKAQRFSVKHRAVKITLIDEFRRFKNAIKRGEIK